MKKLLTSASIILLFSVVPLSHAYNTAQRITFNDYDDTSAMISNNGDLVWIQDIHYDTQIKLRNINGNYQNFPNITYLEERQLQMSANGNVVWQRYNDATDEDEIVSETFPYNGVGQNISLSPDHKDRDPHINDNGHVVWLRKHTHILLWDVYFYDGNERHNLTHNSIVNISDNEAPQINNNSQVVWSGNNTAERDIHLFDSQTGYKNLSDGFDSYQDGDSRINNNGEVVWQGSKSNKHWIFYYDGNASAKLAEGHSPQINDLGDIVWFNDHQVFLYRNGNIENITNYLVTGDDPQINNNGQVVWSGEGGFGEDIFLYDYYDNTLKNISHHIKGQKMSPRINDNGHVVWQGMLDSENDWEVFCYCPGLVKDKPYGVVPEKPSFGIGPKEKVNAQ